MGWDVGMFGFGFAPHADEDDGGTDNLHIPVLVLSLDLKVCCLGEEGWDGV